MDRKEILELATDAAQGNHQARARFIAVALAAGFVGGPGGWVRHGEQRNVCQGWAALAGRAKMSGWVLETLVASEAARVELTAGGTVEPAGLEMPGMWEDADVMGGEPEKEYGLEVLAPVSGVARVALTEELDGQVSRRVKVFHGDTALADATSFMLQLQAGTAKLEEPTEPRVHPGDVVTVHRGLRRYEVLRVELDAWKNGERCDYARISPCAPEDEREPQWVAMDLLHVVAPVATLHAVTVNGFLVTDELVDLCHHATGVAQPDTRRIALIRDPGMGEARTTPVLVDPRFPRGAMPGAEEVAERPAMFPGDSVMVERPGQTMPSVYRWMPDLDDTDRAAVLQDVTWVRRTREPVTS